MALTVKELARLVGAEYRGDGEAVIESAAPIESAGPGQISFLANPKYKPFLATTRASALVVAPDIVTSCPAIIHKSPYLLFAQIIDILYPQETPNWGIHSTAVVASTASLPDKVRIEPHVVIEDKVVIGAGTIIKAGTFIGEKSYIGTDCRIGPNVTIMHGCKLGDGVIIHGGTVIGSDGFGFAPTGPGQEYRKIKQVGWVEIGDHVEIGANVTIDRGATGPTVIERGAKIDNLVMIAHNVKVGENSIIVAQVGISGSTKLGKAVVLAGQVGLVGHLEIGDYAMVGAQSGVAKSLEGGQAYFGSPARPIKEEARIEAAIRHLPELIKRVAKIEHEIGLKK